MGISYLFSVVCFSAGVQFLFIQLHKLDEQELLTYVAGGLIRRQTIRTVHTAKNNGKVQHFLS